MANLSAYINFAIVLDKSLSTPAMKLVDTGSYPSGVANNLIGYFSITQPDGITVTGSFASPDIYWSSGALVQASKELRLDNSNNFQQGGYSLTYYIRVPGYDDTTLTKTFSLSYTQPVLTISEGFDEFTPQLTVTDSTTYTKTGFTYVGVVQSWAATIRSVSGTDENITGAGATFDLNWMGDYYDSYYDVTLTAEPSWKLVSPDDWVTVVDKIVLAETFQAQIPPTLVAILASLTTLKSEVDAAIANCNTYSTLLANYELAVSIYTHMIYRGREDDVAGLSEYVLQLQKIFNNNVNPTYTNTNGVIPAYDWTPVIGTIPWSNVTGKPATVRIIWTVGMVGFPVAGATSLTDARLANYDVRMWRNGLAQLNFDPGSGNTYYTKTLSASVVNFPALATDEEIIIETIPL